MQFDSLGFDQHGNPFRRSTQSPLGLVAGHLADTTLAMRALVDRLFGNPDSVNHSLRSTSKPAREICVLELGFGAGVNFMALRREWLVRPVAQPLTYCAIDPVPLSGHDVSAALRRLGFAPADVQPLAEQWPEPVNGLHCLTFAGGIRLLLLFGDLETGLRRIPGLPAALILSDPGVIQSAPAHPARTAAMLASVVQPGSQILTARLSRSWAGVFASQALTLHRGDRVGAGVAGYLHGADTRLRRRTRHLVSTPGPHARVGNGDDVLVLGAGLAGTTIASALARAGLPVHMVDTLPGNGRLAPQQQAAIAAHLHLAADDNALARLSRAALAFTACHGGALRYPGRLLLGSAPSDALQRAASQLPASIATPVNKSQASDLAGLAVTSGGLWLPGVPVWVAEDQPPAPDGTSYTRALVTGLSRTDSGWIAYNSNGQDLGTYSRVIIATGLPPALAGLDGIVSGRPPGDTVVAGLSSTVTVTKNTLRCVLSDRHYLIPLPDGQWLAGASYHAATGPGDADDEQRVKSDHLANLAGVSALLEQPGQFAMRVSGANQGQRVMLPDRLPMIGPAPDVAAISEQRQVFARNDRLALPTLPGLYLAVGLGSRGLLWSSLAAQLVSDWLTGRTVAVESDLLRAVSADRFIRRMLRREQQK